MATLKLPKTLGKCVDLYLKLRTERLAEDKKTKALKEDEELVKNHLINTIDKRDESGAVGATHTAVVKTDTQYIVEDWALFYAHIKKTGEFDLMGRTISQPAIQERVEAQTQPTGKRGEGWKPKLPPGIGRMNVVKLSVTKR